MLNWLFVNCKQHWTLCPNLKSKCKIFLNFIFGQILSFKITLFIVNTCSLLCSCFPDCSWSSVLGQSGAVILCRAETWDFSTSRDIQPQTGGVQAHVCDRGARAERDRTNDHCKVTASPVRERPEEPCAEERHSSWHGKCLVLILA